MTMTRERLVETLRWCRCRADFTRVGDCPLCVRALLAYINDPAVDAAWRGEKEKTA